MSSVRYLDRKLLRNILHHTETHNRLQEEEEMWRSRAKEAFGWKHDPFNPGGRRGRGRWNRNRRVDRLHQMNPDSQGVSDHRNWDGQRNRDIYRAELGNQERWGHTGFMELYPEEFIKKDSMDEMSSDDDKETRKKKKIKHKRKHDAQHDMVLNKRIKGGENWSSSESNTSPASSQEREAESSARRGTHHSRRQSPPPSRQFQHRGEPRRVPSSGSSKIGNHHQATGRTNHTRAPSGSPEKSSSGHRERNKVDRREKRATEEGERDRRNKNVSGHRHKDGTDAHNESSNSLKRKHGADHQWHRKRTEGYETVAGEKEEHRASGKRLDKKERPQVAEETGEDWKSDRKDRDGSRQHHHHKSSRKDKKPPDRDKDDRHKKRK
ncbi:uncharacterized protein C11orf57-like [Acanthaster planci]|uniref:Uncharacterized protein C11orf57-like n=1 Tax=Acanthaster planci TaxID=133434 RepID=A0A8B7YY10_ACAPL|nr:uncharacterized protein C11orf57-like [Acanthaster planci]XP_022097572.1 uncharacterized protein C11orf57-like [Acanthaster planci]